MNVMTVFMKSISLLANGTFEFSFHPTEWLPHNNLITRIYSDALRFIIAKSYGGVDKCIFTSRLAFFDMIIIRREEVVFNSELNDTCPDWKMYAYSGRAGPPSLRTADLK